MLLGVLGVLLLNLVFSVLTRLLEALIHKDLPFLGRGKAVFRTWLIGGRAPGRFIDLLELTLLAALTAFLL